MAWIERRRQGAGFTLIELVIVMAIIALLLTLAAPRYFKSLDRSKETVLRSNLAAVRDALDRIPLSDMALPHAEGSHVRLFTLTTTAPGPV